jgi:hypothetical protein
MHTRQAVITRLESGRVKPSTRTLERLAAATEMKLRIFVRAGGSAVTDTAKATFWKGENGSSGKIRPGIGIAPAACENQ